jgi:uncharacterized membrane protein YraQ (UPF0718 family)
MDSEAAFTTQAAPPGVARGSVIGGALVVLTVAGALVAYKASSSLAALAKARATGTMAPKTPALEVAGVPLFARPFVDTFNYFGWVFIALAFGVVLGAAVKALVPRRWLARSVAAPGAAGPLVACAVGAPLMLCSCCSAPVFEGVYDRSKRLGPSVALMLASPALNPAALALTFVLLPARFGWARLAASFALVLLAAAAVERGAHAALAELAPSDGAADGDASTRALARDFVRSLGEVARRSLPAIALGVLVSVILAGLVPFGVLASASGGSAWWVLAAATLAVPIAMPTFAELPIGLGLLAAGAPEGAVVAILIAGPAVNLPSLFTVGRAASTRAALLTAGAVWAAAVGAGLALGAV